MSQEQNTTLSMLQKLAEDAKKKASNTNNKTSFNDLIVVNLGTEPKEHFPKLKDSDGNKITEIVDGRTVDKRSETSDGYTYTFSEYLTCRKIQVVFPKFHNLKILGVFKVSGLGYDMKSANMVFIDENGSIVNFE